MKSIKQMHWWTLVTDREQWTLKPYSLLRRILVNLVGVVIVSIGIGVCNVGFVGVDPYAAFLMALSHLTGIAYTWMVPLVNTILFILIVIPFDRSIFGFGMITNMTLVGFFTDTFTSIYHHFYNPTFSWWILAIHLVIGLFFFCLGVSLQIRPNLGACPYDGIAPSLHRHFPKISYRVFRTCQDIITIIIAGILIKFNLGIGILGIGTIIMGFFIGTIVDWFSKHFTEKLLGVRGENNEPIKKAALAQ
ncbi:hypothetical protein [Bifidobacterium sp. ESL0732]|uniref:YczE/YyaS/YitT family protein n=1 Tax=Bifidobacterium sp. ESL0732 TaxID=2983222 RepID=UPI0023F73551|nr:hypothetical protein [Bifidobacterium sp. ESL0732]WEV64712.1 hypothetical protein OZX70_03855 [Bifidobacterium sp. ESL0732]